MTTNKEVKDREREYHNKVFSEGSASRDKALIFYSITGASTNYYLENLRTRIGNGKNLLEYGCGAGGDLNLYKTTNTNLFGIDISKEAIQLAKKKCNELNIDSNYIVADAEDTNLENNFFDAIVGSGIIHHLDIDKAMLELSRIIKPDGACIFHEPMGHNLLINLYRKLTPHMRTPDEHPILEDDFKIMKKYFAKLEIKYFYLFSLSALIFKKTKFFNLFYKILSKLDELVIHLFSSLGKYSWVSVIILSKPIKR